MLDKSIACAEDARLSKIENAISNELDKAMCNHFSGGEGRTRFGYGDAIDARAAREGRTPAEVWEDIFGGNSSRNRASRDASGTRD